MKNDFTGIIKQTSKRNIPMLLFQKRGYFYMNLFDLLTFPIVFESELCNSLTAASGSAHDAAETLSQNQSCQLFQTCLLFATPRTSPFASHPSLANP